MGCFAVYVCLVPLLENRVLIIFGDFAVRPKKLPVIFNYIQQGLESNKYFQFTVVSYFIF